MRTVIHPAILMIVGMNVPLLLTLNTDTLMATTTAVTPSQYSGYLSDTSSVNGSTTTVEPTATDYYTTEINATTVNSTEPTSEYSAFTDETSETELNTDSTMFTTNTVTDFTTEEILSSATVDMSTEFTDQTETFTSEEVTISVSTVDLSSQSTSTVLGETTTPHSTLYASGSSMSSSMTYTMESSTVPTEGLPPPPRKNKVAIGVGTTFGILGAVLIVAGITIGIQRRNRDKGANYANLDSVRYENPTYDMSNEGFSFS